MSETKYFEIVHAPWSFCPLGNRWRIFNRDLRRGPDLFLTPTALPKERNAVQTTSVEVSWDDCVSHIDSAGGLHSLCLSNNDWIYFKLFILFWDQLSVWCWRDAPRQGCVVWNNRSVSPYDVRHIPKGRQETMTIRLQRVEFRRLKLCGTGKHSGKNKRTLAWTLELAGEK